MKSKRWSLVLIVIGVALLVGALGGWTGYTAATAPTEVYLGGIPIGVRMDCAGLMIENVVLVTGAEDPSSPAADAGLRPGDIILKINGNAVTNPVDFGTAVTEEAVTLCVSRGGVEFECVVTPKFDRVAESFKLGLRVKNEIAGVGTLTYVRTDNGRFGGLGHPIYQFDATDTAAFQAGTLYACKIASVVKGQVGKPGELRGSFDRGSEPTGTIESNEFCGIFGESNENLTKNLQKIAIGDRRTIRPGKAKIYTTIAGDTPQYYDVEIVKTARQNEPKDKSMVIHVTDEALLEKTGGIVQGMSGSPIIQDGKLVGALTHVFINDPTRGYGIYLDWMLNH